MQLQFAQTGQSVLVRAYSTPSVHTRGKKLGSYRDHTHGAKLELLYPILPQARGSAEWPGSDPEV